METDEHRVGAWLEEWLQLVALQLAPASEHAYRGIVQRYLLPHIGEVSLAELTGARITVLYQELLAGGGKDGKPLALATVKKIHEVLRKALNDAVRHDRIAANPCRKALVPKRDPRHVGDAEDSIRSWTAEELRTFLHATRDHRFGAIWELMARTGMRRGEALGLRWVDVDLDRRTLHVRRALTCIEGVVRLQQPKTARFRALHVDGSTVALLQRRRRQQERERQAAGATWANRRGLVFTAPTGEPVIPPHLSVAFRELIPQLDVTPITMHGLRHTHATLLLQRGVPVHVVSQRLGHSHIAFTLDVYADVLPAQDDQAATEIERLLDADSPSADEGDDDA